MVMMYVHALVRRDVFFFLFDTHRSPFHMRDARQEKEKEEREKKGRSHTPGPCKTPRWISAERPTTGRRPTPPLSRKGLFSLLLVITVKSSGVNFTR